MPDSSIHPFDEVVQMPESEIRLAAAALLFARDAYPHLESPGYLSRLDHLADRVSRIPARRAANRLEAIRQVVCLEEKFAGDSENYYDPRNSYLNAVLDRKRGIPITLSVIWLDIARKLDWPIVGVNFPGHFMVRYESPGRQIYVDPFTDGAELEESDLAIRLQAQFGASAHLDPAHLTEAGTFAILMRMLNNLRGIYLQTENWPAAESVLARQSALQPQAAEIWSQRGQVLMQMGRNVPAIACLERSLDLLGDHPESENVRRSLSMARQNQAEAN